MFGSQILEVAIGLVLVFLLVSLVLTAVQEAIEAWFRSRAGDLNRALFELFQNDEAVLARFQNHPLIFALHRSLARDAGPQPEDTPERSIASYRVPSRAERRLLPSYIPREAFAAVFLDLIKSGAIRNDNLLEAYDALNRVTGGNLARMRAEIEGWFDGAMDRASGWFKRRTQKTLFGLGLATALLLNINAVTIGRYLATDDGARALATSYAQQVIRAGEPGTADIPELQRELQDSIGLPIGWSETSLQAIAREYPLDPGAAPLAAFFAGVTLLLGYVAVAFAAMLGAPFWFDVLNRVMVIRSTVKPKEKSPDEPSEDGGTSRPARPSGSAGGTAGGAAPSAGSGGTPVLAFAAPPAPPPLPTDDDDEAELDGCLADEDLAAEEITEDIDLPPTTGGVETR